MMIALNNIKKGIPSGILMKNIYFSFFLTNTRYLLYYIYEGDNSVSKF